MENINQLKENNIPVFSIQSTYTDHLSDILPKENLIDFFINNFDFHFLTVGDDMNSKGLEYVENEETIIKSLKENDKLVSSLTSSSLRNAITNQPNKNKCGASNHMILIHPNGDIYPCQIFIGESKNKLGNIFNFDKETFNQKRERFNERFLQANKCDNCLAKYICNICLKGISSVKPSNCNRIVKHSTSIFNNLPKYIQDETLDLLRN